MPGSFDEIPKSRYWQVKAHSHLGQHGLTERVIVDTLTEPTDLEIQEQRRGRFTVYYRYFAIGTVEAEQSDYSAGGVWFRVIFNARGELHTAFRDNITEQEGGREVCPTPGTRENF